MQLWLFVIEELLRDFVPQFYCFKHDGVLSRRASYDNEVVRVAAYMLRPLRFDFTSHLTGKNGKRHTRFTVIVFRAFLQFGV